MFSLLFLPRDSRPSASPASNSSFCNHFCLLLTKLLARSSLSPLCGVLCDCAACVRPASSASFLPWYALYFQVAFENFPICGKSFSTFYRYRFLSGEQAVACLASFSCAVFWPAVRDEARYLWSIFSKQKLLRNRLVFGDIFLPHFTT